MDDLNKRYDYNFEDKESIYKKQKIINIRIINVYNLKSKIIEYKSF